MSEGNPLPFSVGKFAIEGVGEGTGFPFHAAVWAVALVTCFGCRRLGETTILSVTSFDSRRHVLCSADITFKTLQDGSCSASFRIPWTKTTCEDGASVIVTARDDQLCPCTALRNHLDTNTDIPGTASLFAYMTPNGQWEHMTKYWFMEFCTTTWTGACLTHVLGHIPPEIVAATRGWTSLAFLLYWRQMEEILPMSTSKAYRRSHIDELAKIFEQFHVNNRIPSNLLASSDCVFEL
ncbi:hypothetical protein BYT27DRAFT_7224662 [Phlegmacium glaucopus]|nr:hypothetical protein BYT27DRAFT_7224662 [Phlegmacium glaucopus]